MLGCMGGGHGSQGQGQLCGTEEGVTPPMETFWMKELEKLDLGVDLW